MPVFLRDLDANVCMVFMCIVFAGNAYSAWHTHSMRHCDWLLVNSDAGRLWVPLGSADGLCVCAVLCAWYAATGRTNNSEPSGCALCVTILCWIGKIVWQIMNLCSYHILLEIRWQDVPCVSQFFCNLFSSYTLNVCPWSCSWWVCTILITGVHIFQNIAMTLIIVNFSIKCMVIHVCFVLMCMVVYEVSGSMCECFLMRQAVGVCALCVVCVLCMCLIVGFEPDDTSSRPGRPGRLDRPGRNATPDGRARGRNATPVGRARSRTR